jgi:hypothetical protein
MSCPYFMPTERSQDSTWAHPERLPLGGTWKGVCTALGNEPVTPDRKQLNNFCNLGYAAACPYLPQQREADAVRFSVANDYKGRIQIWYTLEMAHHPGQHGILEYDSGSQRWISTHADSRVQKMAECHLESYLAKRRTGPSPTSH